MAELVDSQVAVELDLGSHYSHYSHSVHNFAHLVSKHQKASNHIQKQTVDSEIVKQCNV